MRRWLSGGAVGLAVLAGFFAAASPKGAWLFDYEAAKALARRSGKPLLVVFR
jgi:hypothetical protein